MNALIPLTTDLNHLVGTDSISNGIERFDGIPRGSAHGFLPASHDVSDHKQAEEVLLKAGALQSAIFNSANFSSIATDANGVIQIFNVGAERMLGYAAAEVMNKITPADISDPHELIARATALSVLARTINSCGSEMSAGVILFITSAAV